MRTNNRSDLKLICDAKEIQSLQNKEVFVFEVQKCKGCSPT